MHIHLKSRRIHHIHVNKPISMTRAVGFAQLKALKQLPGATYIHGIFSDSKHICRI